MNSEDWEKWEKEFRKKSLEILTQEISLATIEAIKELCIWQYDYTASFYNMLFYMFQKADNDNRYKLGKAFPEHYRAWQLWNLSGNAGIDLFEKYIPEFFEKILKQ